MLLRHHLKQQKVNFSDARNLLVHPESFALLPCVPLAPLWFLSCFTQHCRHSDVWSVNKLPLSHNEALPSCQPLQPLLSGEFILYFVTALITPKLSTYTVSDLPYDTRTRRWAWLVEPKPDAMHPLPSLRPLDTLLTPAPLGRACRAPSTQAVALDRGSSEWNCPSGLSMRMLTHCVRGATDYASRDILFGCLKYSFPPSPQRQDRLPKFWVTLS